MGEIVVVSNTGPLVSALQCGRIDLLRRYFVAIHIPETVLLELRRHGAGDAADQLVREGLFVVEKLGPDEIVQAEHLARQIAASKFAKVEDYAPHIAEAEAIVLMQRAGSQAARLLLEEKAAREVATRLRLPLSGFVGVLLSACQDEILTAEEARSLLQDCRRQGTHYSEALIADTYRRCVEMRRT